MSAVQHTGGMKTRKRSVILACVGIVLLVGIPPQVSLPPSPPILFGTPVGGNITNDTTWTAANSPYWITTDTYVLAGISLRIESGVRVQFDRADLMVAGSLEALGTSLSPVVFTTNDTPAANWGPSAHSSAAHSSSAIRASIMATLPASRPAPSSLTASHTIMPG